MSFFTQNVASKFINQKSYFMKKVFLGLLCCSLFTTIYAQTTTTTTSSTTSPAPETLKPVKEHYTISGGVLGAVNSSQFRFKDNDAGNIDYDFKGGWAAGIWVNFPVASAFSIEPQLTYGSYGYRSNASNTQQLLLNEGKIKYLSVPLLLKFHLGDKFALTAGPQLDFVTNVEDESGVSNAVEEDFNQSSFSLFGGFEILPHGRVSIFGRYIHGLSDMNDSEGGELRALEYKNQAIQAGLKLKLFGKKIPADTDGDGVADPNDKCPAEAGYSRYDGCPIPDTDKDGINDEQDKCPTQAGTAKYNGCPIPDTDKDGINDEEDKCPNEAGTAKYNGCPIPDTDKDGINDEEDKCPNEAGIAKYNGCPIPDRDNDGVNDEEDRCPDIAGSRANNGCPDVPADVSKTLSSSARNISFTANSAKLTARSNSSLDQVAKAMREHPEMKLKIEGHADNTERDMMKVSEDRATAVKNYLVSKGISADRIEVEGFGETTPIADNGSSAGRTKNRRVEIKVVY